MKEEKYVEFDIGPDGSVTFEGVGFTGDACHDALKAYAKAIGLTVSSSKKPEYNLKEKVKEKAKVKA
jgi:hypothetical protein